MTTKNLKKVLLASVLSLGLILFIGCKGKGDSSVLKLSHNHATGYPVDVAYKKFAEIIEQKSEGKYKIQIYPSAQLGDQKASLELAKSGVIQFAHINTAVLEGFDQIYSILNLPYIYKDYEHYRRVMDSDKMTEIFESTLDKGFISLIYIEGGARSIYTKPRGINTPADLRGLKIRVQDSPTAIEMVQLLGGTPVTLNFSEVYTSLQQGVIDGAENNMPSYVETAHCEVAKYFSLTEHTRLSDILAIGAPFWNSLTDEEKQMFRDAAKETEDFFAGLWAESENKSTERAINEYNSTIVKSDINLFRNLMKPMHDNWANRETRFKELIDFIKNLENE